MVQEEPQEEVEEAVPQAAWFSQAQDAKEEEQGDEGKLPVVNEAAAEAQERGVKRPPLDETPQQAPRRSRSFASSRQSSPATPASSAVARPAPGTPGSVPTTALDVQLPGAGVDTCNSALMVKAQQWFAAIMSNPIMGDIGQASPLQIGSGAKQAPFQQKEFAAQLAQAAPGKAPFYTAGCRTTKSKV